MNYCSVNCGSSSVVVVLPLFLSKIWGSKISARDLAMAWLLQTAFSSTEHNSSFHPHPTHPTPSKQWLRDSHGALLVCRFPWMLQLMPLASVLILNRRPTAPPPNCTSPRHSFHLLSLRIRRYPPRSPREEGPVSPGFVTWQHFGFQGRNPLCRCRSLYCRNQQ